LRATHRSSEKSTRFHGRNLAELVFDLAQVTFIDSAGLSVLIRA
jgi:anti-anti-sigma regulatory factor